MAEEERSFDELKEMCSKIIGQSRIMDAIISDYERTTGHKSLTMRILLRRNKKTRETVGQMDELFTRLQEAKKIYDSDSVSLEDD